MLRESADPILRDLLDVAYLTGQRPVDIVNLQPSQIIDGVWQVRQQKTKNKVSIAIVGKLKEILDRRI